jgi:hypothetical protein
MKVQRKISPTTIIEAEGQTVAEVFEALARLEEIFGAHETCGLCQKTGVLYTVREDKQNNKYYMARCVACGAEFRYGVKRQPEGALFPQLKDQDGKPKANGGWAKWEPRQQYNQPSGQHQSRYSPPQDENIPY